jgi:hypothetical protein
MPLGHTVTMANFIFLSSEVFIYKVIKSDIIK